jgi:hypothetical protein
MGGGRDGPSISEHHRAISERRYHRIVGPEHDRGPTGDRAEVVQQRLDARLVEEGRRLVEDEKGGITEQRSGKAIR